MRWAWLRWALLGLAALVAALHVVLLALEDRLLLAPERVDRYRHFGDPALCELRPLPSGGLLARLKPTAAPPWSVGAAAGPASPGPLDAPAAGGGDADAVPPAAATGPATGGGPLAGLETGGGWGTGRPRAALFCHGNAGSLDGGAPIAAGLAARGYDVHLLEYAGFGMANRVGPLGTAGAVPGATGGDAPRPSPATLLRDLREAWRELPDRSSAVLIGFSMGGGCVCQLLSELEDGDLPEQTVILNSFFSLPRLVQDILPVSVLGPLMRTRWDATDGLRRLRGRRLLVVAAPDDELVPFRHSELLVQAAREAGAHAELLALPGGGHVDAPAVHAARWLDALVPARGPARVLPPPPPESPPESPERPAPPAPPKA